MFVFWFNTFFIDMHLLQQSNTTPRDRPSSHHKNTANNVGNSDHRNPSTSSEAGTSAVTSHGHGSHRSSKGHHRQRSDTPGAPGGRSSKSHHPSHYQRAMSPSTSKSVCVYSLVCPVMHFCVPYLSTLPLHVPLQCAVILFIIMTSVVLPV